MRIVIAALLLLPGAALAGSAFDGTWKLRPDSAKVTGKADQFQILDGMYSCSSCVPQIKVKADGSDQKVEGHDYYDTVAVTVVSPSTIHMVRKKAGKLAASVNYEVSTDGNTLTIKFQDYTGGHGYVQRDASRRGPAGFPPGIRFLAARGAARRQRSRADVRVPDDERSVQHALERPEL